MTENPKTADSRVKFQSNLFTRERLPDARTGMSTRRGAMKLNSRLKLKYPAREVRVFEFAYARFARESLREVSDSGITNHNMSTYVRCVAEAT
jgi:hypothetical protein